MKTDVIISRSEKDTEALAAKLASELPRGSVLAMHGNLGAGKTVFARGFARALGITEPISSPTFTIVQEYPCRNGMFFHLDLYRIDNSDAALAFGIDEFLDTVDSVTLLEWSERITDLLPPNTIHIRLESTDHPNERQITVIWPDRES